LNEVLRDAILWQPPPIKRSGAKSQAKIYYCSQVATEPPTIVVFCNDPSAVHDNYRRYLDRKFRESINGFEATPIRWIFRGRRQREMMRNAAGYSGSSGGGGGRSMNAAPYGGVGASGSSPFPHAD
jgi:GTPase